jgi:lipoprotein NlpD
MKSSFFKLGLLVIVAVAGAACTSNVPAPVEDRSVSKPTASTSPNPRGAAPVVDARPPTGAVTSPNTAAMTGPTHTVQRGENLLGIAVAYNVNYRDLAEWNGLANPSAISVGQVLRVTAPEGWIRGATSADSAALKPSTAVSGAVTTAAVKPPTTIEAKPIGSEAAPNSTTPTTSAPAASATPTTSTTPATPITAPTKSEPKANKVPYSDSTLAQMSDSAAPAATSTPAITPAPTTTNPTTSSPASPPTSASTSPTGALQLGWPTKETKVLRGFSEQNKGLNLAGKKGDAVLAAGTGKVLLASTLRGYGKIVIVQHDSQYLTAYAHNDKLLVKEGQQVKRGERIAEMGNSGSEQVMLHFEVRKGGVPIDPTPFLPKQ